MRNRVKSLYARLLVAFILSSIIPILVVNLFSYYNSTNIVKNHYEELTNVNLERTKSSIDITLHSYQDILYQIYTDDEIVELVDKINEGEDVSEAKSRLRHILRGLFYTKDYIKSITVLLENGTVVFYDQLTASSTVNSWLQNYHVSAEDIYSDVSGDNELHLYPTQYATTFSNENYYLFHIGHRIINYKDVSKQYGVVLISIDETLLKEICIAQSEDNRQELRSFNFIVDRDGYIISYPDNNHFAKQSFHSTISKAEKTAIYESFILSNNIFRGANINLSMVQDEDSGWDVINVSNQSKYLEQLSLQKNVLFLIMGITISSMLAIILFQIKHLTSSIGKVVLVMNAAGHEHPSGRVELSEQMPTEIKTIAANFNEMMDRLERSIAKEKEAFNMQRDAEIKALEAQINPHFLYNTLDTINWMAIDKDEYEISNAINALATILRYGIDDCNRVVLIKEEIAWLDQYLLLQKTRMKNTFTSIINAAPQTLGYKIHKLLLQPFVENAIMHGFCDNKTNQMLCINIDQEHDYLVIKISDNGCGMDSGIVEEINNGNYAITTKSSIGIKNAITRIKMYYGEQARVTVYSNNNIGTTIIIRIPIEQAR